MVVRCPQLLLSDVRNVVVPSLQYILRCTQDHDDLAKRFFRDPNLLVVSFFQSFDSEVVWIFPVGGSALEPLDLKVGRLGRCHFSSENYTNSTGHSPR